MRQKFKARELWLLAPFLIIGGLAFYWARAGQVTTLGGRWTTTSTVKVEAAPGYYQEQGKLHRVTVTLSHPWPHPSWWGQNYSVSAHLDPLHPEQDARRPLGQVGPKDEQGVVRSGALFSTQDDNGATTIPPLQGVLFSSPKFDGDKCVFNYDLDLNKIAAAPQPLTLHGAYIFGGGEPTKIEHLIRKKGEVLAIKPDKNPGAQLVSVNASFRFYQSSSYPVGKPVEYTDFTTVFFLIRPQEPPATSENNEPQIKVYDLEIRDEKGKLYREYAPYGVFFSDTNGVKPAENQVRPNEILHETTVNIKNSLHTSGDLTLSGKVSVNEHWPIPFKVKLPPRSSATPSWSSEETWKRPTKAAPIR